MKEKMKKAFSKKWILLIGIVILVVVAVFLLSSPKREKTMDRGATQIQVARRDITATITGTAVIEPKEEYAVTSLVNGDVLTANFEEGDYVQKGDVLYQLDARDIENNLASADVAIKKAQNNYDEAIKSQQNTYVTSSISGVIKTLHVKSGDFVQNGARIADVYDDSVMELTIPFNQGDIPNLHVGSEAVVYVIGTNDALGGTVTHINDAGYTKAGNMRVCDVVIKVKNPGTIMNGDKATATVGGIACNDLGSFGYITEKTIIAKSAGTVKKIHIKAGNTVSAGETIAELENDSVHASVVTNALLLEDAHINKSKTTRQLDDYTITAPISGKIITKNTKAGDKLDVVGSQEPMAVIYDMSSLKFDIMIDELDINKITLGQMVRITADALNGKEYIGYVDKISIDGVESNGVTSYPVSVSISDFDEDLLPGMNIDAEIAVGNATNVLAIPKSAVTRDNIVYVVGEKEDISDQAPEGYKSVKVVTGLNDGNYIEIVSGLSDTDFVKIDVINNGTGFSFMGMSGGGMGPHSEEGMPR